MYCNNDIMARELGPITGAGNCQYWGEEKMTEEDKDKCGYCQNFKPKPDDKFFNCTDAKHAGLKYGMQVRVDSRACEAFVPK
jgi:hypothetical protein